LKALEARVEKNKNLKVMFEARGEGEEEDEKKASRKKVTEKS
jgi:hypothetical protein